MEMPSTLKARINRAPDGSRPHGAIDAGRQRDQHDDQACREHELEACRKFGEDHLKRRPLVDVGGAEIARWRSSDIAHKLHRPGRIEAELMAKRGALAFRHRLTRDLA